MFSSLIQPMNSYWQQANFSQRFLLVTGSVLFVWMVAHAVMLGLPQYSVDGAASPRKAATFAETGWLMCWATAYVLPHLTLKRWQRWAIVGGVLQFAIVETLLVSVQVWRGVPSHYNFATTFDMVVFSVMGAGSTIYLVGMIVLLVALYGKNTLSPSMRLAFRSGTVLMIIGGLLGYFMLMSLGGVFTGTLGIFTAEIPGTYLGVDEGTYGGNILVLHALGVHGLSMAPLAAWLLSYAKLTEQTRVRITSVVVYSLYAVFALLFTQMLMRQPLTAIGVPIGSMLVASVVVVATGYFLAGWHGLRGGRM